MTADTKTLSQVIASLPGPDLDDIGIKELVLRLIVETPMDSPDGKNASRAKVKLDALRLLADINKNNSTMLKGAKSVATFTIEDGTFAIVASKKDNGVQIIEVSDPQNPVAVGFAIDGQNGFDMLGRASGVDTFTIGTLTYAIVASVAADGVQIIDVTDPSRPVAVSSATDGEHGFTKLAGARGVSIVVLGPVTYAVVTGSFDNGVQLIDVSDPYKPVAVGSATHGEGGYDPLSGASGVATFGIDGTMYVIVASRDDNGVMLIHVVGGEGKGGTKFGTPSGPTQDEFDHLKDGQNELKDKVEILKEQLAAILAALNVSG